MNHAIDQKLGSHRPSVAQYEKTTRPIMTSQFSRTYRKTQLLRKLDGTAYTPLQQLLFQKPTTSELTCNAIQTPLHNAKDKFNSKSKDEPHRKQVSSFTQTETDLFTQTHTFFRGKMLMSRRRMQLVKPESEMQSCRIKQQHSNKAHINSLQLQTMPSINRSLKLDHINLQPFLLDSLENDQDLLDYLNRKSRLSRKASQQ